MNLQWAYVIGNHDEIGNYTHRKIMELDSSHPLSLSAVGPIEVVGACNFYIPIQASDKQQTASVLCIISTCILILKHHRHCGDRTATLSPKSNRL